MTDQGSSERKTFLVGVAVTVVGGLVLALIVGAFKYVTKPSATGDAPPRSDVASSSASAAEPIPTTAPMVSTSVPPPVDVSTPDPITTSPPPAAQVIQSVTISTNITSGGKPVGGVMYANINSGTQVDYRYGWNTLTNYGELTTSDCSVQGVATDVSTGAVVSTSELDPDCQEIGWQDAVLPIGSFVLTVTVNWNGQSVSGTENLQVVAH